MGGSLEGMPMYTLTTRKGNPDRLELRYAETDVQVTLIQTDLAPLIDTWLDVTETITYGIDGTYEITINRVGDNETLFTYSNSSIVNWRPGATFVRPKWGIYRSLINDQDLRDEKVLYADFSIEEIDVVSSENSELNNNEKIIFTNLIEDRLFVKNLPQEISSIQIFSIDGRKIMDKNIDSVAEVNIDVSSITKGVYILIFRGKQIHQVKLFMIK